MPILYVSVLTKDKKVISQALGTKITGNFHQLVAQNTSQFQRFGKKKIALDSELALCYMDQKDYSIACIKNTYDITDLEAQRFMQAVEALIVDFIKGYELERTQGSVVIQNYIGDASSKSSTADQLNAELPAIDKINESTLNDNKFSTHFSKMRS